MEKPNEMPEDPPRYEVRLARTETEVRAAQRLRYRVFVEELGADGAMVDHAAGLERDRFDDHSSQLILIDHNREDDAVVGVYRLIAETQAAAAGGFSSGGWPAVYGS